MKKNISIAILGAVFMSSFILNQAQAQTAPCTTTVLNVGVDGPDLSAVWIYCEGADSQLCKGTINGANTAGVSCTVGHQPYTRVAAPAPCIPVSALNLEVCP